MFTAQVYSVCVTSLGAILGEEHLCREVIARWNQSRSREAGRVLLPLQGADTHRPDLYVVLIGSYVDAAKAEAILSTGERVVMMFSTWHDPDSTLPTEVEQVAAFRAAMQGRCTCVDYAGKASFEEALMAQLDKI